MRYNEDEIAGSRPSLDPTAKVGGGGDASANTVGAKRTLTLTLPFKLASNSPPLPPLLFKLPSN